MCARKRDRRATWRWAAVIAAAALVALVLLCLWGRVACSPPPVHYFFDLERDVATESLGGPEIQDDEWVIGFGGVAPRRQSLAGRIRQFVTGEPDRSYYVGYVSATPTHREGNPVAGRTWEFVTAVDFVPDKATSEAGFVGSWVLTSGDDGSEVGLHLAADGSVRRSGEEGGRVGRWATIDPWLWVEHPGWPVLCFRRTQEMPPRVGATLEDVHGRAHLVRRHDE